MGELASFIQDSWMVGRDFNIVRNGDEKIGGLPVTIEKINDFNHCINIFHLDEIAFKGNKYIWWNGRIDEKCIFKRLDRVFGK